VIKQLQMGSRGFHCKSAKDLTVSTVSTVSLKTKFEGVPSMRGLTCDGMTYDFAVAKL